MESEPKSRPPVLVSGTINANPETIHAALTDPALLKRWYSAWAGCEITRASVEAKRGGAYRIDARTKYGTNCYIRGEFLHLSPHLIAITWATDFSGGFESTVYLSIDPTEAGTSTVSIEHHGLRTDGESKRTGDGWTHVLAIMRKGVPRLDESQIPSEVREYLKRAEKAHLKHG
jgi:uncharacterized protein YndB with AHSA1/START domain